MKISMVDAVSTQPNEARHPGRDSLRALTGAGMTTTVDAYMSSS